MLLRTHIKNVISLIIDFTVAYFVFAAGMYVRLGDDFFLPVNLHNILKEQAIIFAVCAAFSSIALSLYKDIWRFFNVDYFGKYFKYATITSLTFLFIIFLMHKFDSFPRSVIIINWILLVFFTAAPRFIYRVLRESSFQSVWKRSNYIPNPVLIVGLSSSTVSFVDEISRLKNKKPFLFACSW